MTVFKKLSSGLLAAAFAATSLALPVVASAQEVPSYAVPAPASQDEVIHGRIASIDSTFGLTVNDDRGFLDRVQLHQGTIINPTGLTLAEGMSVTITGFNSGGYFNANQIDTPYTYSGPAPVPVYYGAGWWYPGYAYGYGPSFSIVFAFGGGYSCYRAPWVGHWYAGPVYGYGRYGGGYGYGGGYHTAYLPPPPHGFQSNPQGGNGYHGGSTGGNNGGGTTSPNPHNPVPVAGTGSNPEYRGPVTATSNVNGYHAGGSTVTPYHGTTGTYGGYSGGYHAQPAGSSGGYRAPSNGGGYGGYRAPSGGGYGGGGYHAQPSGGGGGGGHASGGGGGGGHASGGGGHGR